MENQSNTNFVRITVLVVTYRQEDVIGRALESILNQRFFGLYQIIVCDDCSPDNTWSVVQNYKDKYPEYIRAYRNNSNKGIYGNYAFSYSLVEDTDYIVHCSGDDALFPHFFESIQKYIVEKQVPVHTSNVIYGDYKIIYPNRRERVVKNNGIELYPNQKAIDLKMKRLVSIRSAVISYECFKRFEKFPLDKGVAMSEVFCDIQPALHSDHNYYLPVVGSIYYADIGVSTYMKNERALFERINAWKAALNTYKFSKSTHHFVNYEINKIEFSLNRSLTKFCKCWWHFSLCKKKISLIDIKSFFIMLFGENAIKNIKKVIN